MAEPTFQQITWKKNFVKKTLKDFRNSLRRRGENTRYFKTGVFVLQTDGGKGIHGLI